MKYFCLPENYEFVTGTRFDNIHLYCELIRVITAGTAHSIKLISEVPLKTDSQYFALFRIIALPTPVLSDTLAVYQLDYDFWLIP